MQNKILIELKKGPKTFKQLKKLLMLNSFDSSKKLDKELRKLWSDKKIFFKRGDETYNIKNDEEIIGTFRETKNDYAFVESEEITIFIPGKFVLNALNGDTVKTILFPVKEGEDPNRRAGKVVRVMQRNGSAIIGRIVIIDGKKQFTPDDIVPKYKYKISDLDEFDEGDIIVTKFIDFVDGVIELKIVKTIGKSSDATLAPEIISYKFPLSTEFSDESLKELKDIKAIKSDSRKDISDRLIYTIDGKESKDLDDAVDIRLSNNGNYLLGVHIADVSYFVKEGSSIDEDAEKRGTSVYLINTVFPMLPKEISNGLCSLNPNTKKFALTCDMEISKDGKLINSEIYESEIVSKHRLTYKEVDDLYSNKENLLINDELTKSLLLARNLSDVLRKNKIENGMIDFVLPEAKISLDASGEVVDIYNKYQTSSERMIEDLMVITNETIAKTLSNEDLPGCFRVHPKPKEENLELFSNLAKTLGSFLPKKVENIESKDLMNFLKNNIGTESESILKRYMIQTMEKAIYKSSDEGHYALGLKNYLHFTSPIRRYPDLVVHRLLKKYFLNKNKEENIRNSKNDIEYLDNISKECSEKEKVAVQSERRLLDIKKARFMKSKIGTLNEGRIVSVVKFGFFVEFENLTQGLVHLDNMKDDEYYYDEAKFSIIGKEHKKVYKLGSLVKVKVMDVNVIKGLIDLVTE